MTNDEKTRQWLVDLEKGIEIGAFQSPLPNIRPVYVDCFEEFAGQECLVNVLADSAKLPFSDDELDFVAASHVLEHIANPIQALLEWTRTTRNGGILYLVMPDRRFTWERNRPAVSASHLVEDYFQGTTQCDGTHIDEFVDYLVWEEFSPDDPGAAARENYQNSLRHSVEQGLDINIHFHAFEPNGFPSIIEAANEVLIGSAHLELVDFEERFPSDCPNGFLAVLKVENERNR